MKKTVPAKESTCSSCQSENTLNYHIICKYAHLYWIPLFTYGKDGALICSSCEAVTEPQNMSKEDRAAFTKAKKATRPPIWHFAGILVFAILAFFIISQNAEQEKNNPIYLADPVAGDVYKLKLESMEYSTMKVLSIDHDTVYVIQNEYTISKRSKIYKIDKEENYSEELTYGITKADLMNMYEEGTIFEVERD